MSLVSQQQLLQNQLQLKQLENQRNKQVQQTKSIVSSNSANLSSINQSNSLNSNSTPQTSNLNNSINQQQNNTSKSKNNLATANYSNPLAITIPTNANPTDILASRFNSWRIIISALSHYLKEIVSVHEEITRQQIRLHHAISFPFLTQGLDGEFYQPLRVSNQSQSNNLSSAIFHSTKSDDSSTQFDPTNDFDLAKKFFLPLGSGSIQDLPTILYQYHSNAALLAQSTVKELTSTIIPRLEDLKRDLLVKIKEIKSLQSDFKNQVNRYQSETSRLLSTFLKSIDYAKQSPSQLDPKNDPYLIKYALDRSIKRQLTEENYLHEAFINIQTSGKELEKVVYIELQTALTVYAKLLGQQAQNVFDGLISKLDSTILTKEPSVEWDSFIDRDNSNFIELDLPMRKLPEIRYKYQYDSLNYEIRSGWLERKSKFLKSYQRAWYVVTSCFLHEFKSNDRRKDPVPERSLPLNELTVTEHSRKDEKNPNSYHKFVIMHGQSAGLLHKGHNWVFRAESYDLMMAWYNDIKKLTQMSGPVSRSTIAAERKRGKRNDILLNGELSSATSILTSRKRGVSSATTKTDNTEILPSNHDNLNSPKTNRNSLSRQPTCVSSLSMGLIDNSDVVLVPIKPEIDENHKQTTIQEEPSNPNDEINLVSPLSSTTGTHEILNSITTQNSKNLSKNSNSNVNVNLNNNTNNSFAEQQALLLQQQTLLEKKQRQLLEEQRELQQRAFSLTSSVQQQYQQQQSQPSNPVHTFSINSEMSNVSSVNGSHNPKNKGMEELSEKVGEISVDESK